MSFQCNKQDVCAANITPVCTFIYSSVRVRLPAPIPTGEDVTCHLFSFDFQMLRPHGSHHHQHRSWPLVGRWGPGPPPSPPHLGVKGWPLP